MKRDVQRAIFVVAIVTTAMFLSVWYLIASIDKQGITGQTILEEETISLQDMTGREILKYYVEPLPEDVGPKYTQAVQEAANYWQLREPIFFQEVESELQADFKIRWVKEFGGENIGTRYNDILNIGLGDSLCLEKWRVYEYDSIVWITTHEFGHRLGKAHIDIEGDIMNPLFEPKYLLSIQETEVLPNNWIRFYPTCSKKETAEFLFEVASTQKLNIYIVPSIEEHKNLLRGKRFIHDPRCHEEKTTFYYQTCTMSKEGGIILENPGSFFGIFGKPAEFTLNVKEL